MKMSFRLWLTALLPFIFSSYATAGDHDLKAIKAEIESIKQVYESRIAELEAKVKSMEASAGEKSVVAASRKTYPRKLNR